MAGRLSRMACQLFTTSELGHFSSWRWAPPEIGPSELLSRVPGSWPSYRAAPPRASPAFRGGSGCEGWRPSGLSGGSDCRRHGTTSTGRPDDGIETQLPRRRLTAGVNRCWEIGRYKNEIDRICTYIQYARWNSGRSCTRSHARSRENTLDHTLDHATNTLDQALDHSIMHTLTRPIGHIAWPRR